MPFFPDEVCAVAERDIFHAAMEIADADERARYLDKACAGNTALKQHVEDMLRVVPRLGTFLETPAVDWEDLPRRPDCAGRFQLGEELARGGMGIVYRARDESLGRDVAVKVLHQRFQVDSLVGRRFVDEARITAQLQHPGIPAVFEVGRLGDERPYLAMKLIKGRTLEELLKERSEPGADRGRFLAVFEQICQTVGYAHSERILHRDLKPANIMVGSFGEVQVMDWGLAKLLEPGAADATETICGTGIQTAREPDSATAAGSMLGTPAFMAPEQAGGELDRLDERTDVFGLGAILCAILTGEPPYTGKSGEAVQLLAIRGKLEDAHARLDRCGADVKLVELCRGCLSAEREVRPRDAGAVAAAVHGYLAGVEERARQAQLERAAVEARAAEQRKRRRVQRVMAAAVLLALVGGILATTWQAQRATEAEATAVSERDQKTLALQDALGQKTAAFEAKEVALNEAERNRRLLYSADVHAASQMWQSEEGTVSQCKQLLMAHVPRPGQLDLREFCWRYQWKLLHQEPVVHVPVVSRAAGVTDDGRVVTLDGNSKVFAWRIGDRRTREEWTLAAGGVLGVALSRNGKVAAVIDPDGSPKVFDVRTGPRNVQVQAPSALVRVKLSADGRFLAGVGRDNHARVWDATNGKELYDYRMIDPTAVHIDLSLDGRQLLASSGKKGTLVVLYRAGEEKPTVLNNDEELAQGGFNRLQGAISPDGKLVAFGSAGNALDLIDATTGKSLQILQSRSTPIRIDFSPDGNLLAVGEKTGLVTLWSIPQLTLSGHQPASAPSPGRTTAGQPLARHLKGHQSAIESLAFTADGRKLIAIGRDKTARCWDVGEQEESRVVQKGRGQIDGLGYSPDGRYLALASMSDGIRVHDLTSAAPPHTLTTRGSRRAVFSPDGGTIAAAPEHRVTLWDARTKDLLCTLAEPEREIGALAFSPDSRFLAVGVGGPNGFATDWRGKVMIFNVADRKEHRNFAASTQVSALAFSSEGKLLAAAGHNGTIWLWNTSTWEQIGCWQGPVGTRYASLLFLPLSGELALGSVSGRIDLWNVKTRMLARQIDGHIDCVSVMALSPDGRTLATGSWDRSIKLWDTTTGRELRTLHREESWMYALTFSPDGNTLASGGLSAELRLWEASSKESVAADLAGLE